MTDENIMESADSMFKKLPAVLGKVMDERIENKRMARDASAVLSEPPPLAFDHEAAGRAIAHARVDDLLKDTNTADALAADFEKKRTSTEAAIIRHEKRKAEAKKQLDQANSFLEALTSQALELDQVLRKVFAEFGTQLESVMAKRLSDAIAHYIDEYVGYRSVIWLQYAQNIGERGGQFGFPEEVGISLTLPLACRDLLPDLLPDDYVLGVDSVVTFKKYDIAALIKKRVIQTMEANSEGLYPSICADLAKETT